MRTLTRKELKYIQGLLERNSELLKSESTNAHRLFCQGLNAPMACAERKMRQRIRRKAVTMAIDLARIYAAGILPCKGSKKEPFKAKSAEGLVEKAGNLLMSLMIADTEKDAFALFQRLNRML